MVHGQQQHLWKLPSSTLFVPFFHGASDLDAGFQVIFAFYIAFYGGVGRMKSGLSEKLTMRSMLMLRLGWPLLAYFFLVSRRSP